MFRAQQNKFVLSTVENLKNITVADNPINGTMSLIRNGDNFYICWCPLDGTPTELITAVFDYLHAPEKDQWAPGEAFSIACSKLTAFVFKEGPKRVEILKNQAISCVLEIDEDELISLTNLIEQLLLNGIAVPSTIDRFSLEFYCNSHRNTYKFVPAHIQLNPEPFTTFEELWKSVLKFFEKLFIHLDSSGTIPHDTEFPVSVAARAVHRNVVEVVEKFKESLPKHEDITVENIDAAFDSKGKLKDPKEFKLRLFHGRTDPKVLTRVIPFAVGIYPYESTKAEREKIDKKLTKEFNDLEEQLTLTTDYQLEFNNRYGSAFRIIDHDVARTDRQMIQFKNLDSPGLVILTKLLRIYVLYNPPISYLQGMNDLLVPFILTFIPNWADDGTPLDENGKEFDYNTVLPMIFWCFDSMLLNINHIEMLRDVTAHCSLIAAEVAVIMEKVSPAAAIWMRMNKLQGLLWGYSDFVLIFKRSFQELWPTWLKFNTAPNPKKYLEHFITSMLIYTFEDFSILPDVTISAMMDAFPNILLNLDAESVGKVALWVAEEFPPTEEDEQNDLEIKAEKEKIIDETKSLEYFTPCV